MMTLEQSEACGLPTRAQVGEAIERGFQVSQGDMRVYCELLLAAWLGMFPELLPADAELLVETITPQKTRIYVQRRGHHA